LLGVDLDEIEAAFLRHAHGLGGLDDPDLLVFGPDHADGRDADHVVDTGPLWGGLSAELSKGDGSTPCLIRRQPEHTDRRGRRPAGVIRLDNPNATRPTKATAWGAGV